MVSKSNYSGLDWLKFVAALFVVANHTGPLLIFNDYSNFLISGLLSRLAVPIFFMTSGFFFFRKLTGERVEDNKRLLVYLRKIGLLYAIAILLYIPLNVYKGDFSEGLTVYVLIKAILFDGTFYHLWYLPALMIGLIIVYYLHKKLSMKTLLVAGTLIYVVGLLGDSYYGITKEIGLLHFIYESMFYLFDYTRNGLFYAPIYLIMGAWAAKRVISSTQSYPIKRSQRIKQSKQRIKPLTSAYLFFLFLVLMFAEGMILQAIEFTRHDSMYVFALPATYFLFQWALSWKGRTGKAFREWRVWIYILHPIAIVLVRGAAEAVSLEAIFISNSLIHFFTVCLLSIAMAAIAVQLSVITVNIRAYLCSGRRKQVDVNREERPHRRNITGS
ncbi:acyltransferase [Paenibacillus sp. L3-i20]|uniref:acyltransferase family protein n=1 Tax=Paenibacillus sp. L3-i20 TaxID=2905833 RepID=UPI001EE032DD|nr:acyltransferase [Paenibacillus sp. L3-i20]GKU78300.1 hypothetical protein L3i20_v226970 [Paenibacillus sp. L3-i20]